jgi:hypothetical protein
VIAFVTEGTFGQAGYREHTLSAIRTGGGSNGGRTWSLVYNHLQSDQIIISDGSSSVPTGGVWPSLGVTRVEIVRSGNSITARTSAFGGTTLLSGSALTVNLTSAAYLTKFQGSKQYGYLVHSQASSFFTNTVFDGVSDDDGLVYDVVTGNVYGPSAESPYYQDVTSVVSPFSDISERGRFYHNPDSGTTVWRSSFDSETYVIGGGGSNADLRVDPDYDEPTDRENAWAAYSRQSMHFFIDDDNNETGNYFGFYNNTRPYTDTVNSTNTIFRINEDGTVHTTNTIHASANGIRFPNDAFGGSGDTASMYLTASSGEATQLTLQMTNDADDEIHFRVPSINGVKINDYTVYHTGNLQGVQGIVGTGMASRTTVSGTTSSIASGGAADLNITGFKGYSLMAITTDRAAWVRLYVNSARRTADASRNEFTDPDPDAGVIVEVITNGAETVLISPAVFGYNYETTPTTNIPCKVTNKSGATSTVTVTLSLVQLEAS